MQGQQISAVTSHKHLGIILNNTCTWNEHLESVCKKAWLRINIMRKLKFTLERKSLEIIYKIFVRPILEYGDIIWCNINQEQKNLLDKIQNEACRIISGTTKLVSLRELSRETFFESLEVRRKKHRLITFYKMYHGLAPTYLSCLVPSLVGNNSRYSLRNADNVQTPSARTNQYQQSFLPLVIREWNLLPLETRESTSIAAFKHFLNNDCHSLPKYYNVGNRKSQVLHSRIRTKCSSLNADLFTRNLVISPLCMCGEREDSSHFFFYCPLYREIRNDLITAVSSVCAISLDSLLFGNANIPYKDNVVIFKEVHKFILKSKRF